MAKKLYQMRFWIWFLLMLVEQINVSILGISTSITPFLRLRIKFRKFGHPKQNNLKICASAMRMITAAHNLLRGRSKKFILIDNQNNKN